MFRNILGKNNNWSPQGYMEKRNSDGVKIWEWQKRTAIILIFVFVCMCVQKCVFINIMEKEEEGKESCKW